MKSNHFKSIFEFIIKVIFIFWCISTPITLYSQGFNNNEWIFGYCEGGDNNYISFGKDGKAKVESLSGDITLGKANTAMAIDPITGEILFYTDGALVYNYLNDAMQGVVGELGGVETARQSVAISALDYDPSPGGSRDFYIFYIDPAGQLQYSLVDMNDQGGAPSNQPAAGSVSQGGTVGNAQGAILAVKSGSSPDYIVSYDNGNLTAKRLEDQPGQFTAVDTLALTSAPQTMLFDEDAGVLYIVSNNPGENLLVVPFDADSGLFGTPEALLGTGGSELITGLAISPDGDFLYYSQGDELKRFFISEEEIAPEIPASQIPDSTAVTLPLTAEIFKIYDVKSGPDGQLYYIYEEVEGGPQYVGRVSNPDEWTMIGLLIEELPFDGSDFCGTVFPQFSPNIDLGPVVDFTWEPEMPCMNTSIQLTSEVTPLNYRPVSFEWEILPPLTDEDGEEIEMDLSVEHLLLPQEATSEQQVTVSLTVTYANGETGNVTKSISLTENNLTAQFSPSDTTLCEPSCIDLMPLLEAQSEGEDGGQGGQQGGGGLGGGTGGQGQGETNYEYFWSNKRDEGWGPEAPNEVCEPGYYWVLVREQGSTCYAYAGIRIKIWDIEDQSNNIWYFGDGAGLDFNRDPDDPNASTPRPIETPHPQDIPAGVTTVSDQTGQVLFYTDGQTVWDLNGDPMQNGEDIGGDNLSSSSVLAVPIATDETLYYLFTTQLGAGGQSEVRYSLVDIKGDNPDGIGNVVTKDNLLFSPSTQHSAAFNSGDTIWVAFHEKGNNTYRLYPVNDDGIAQPVFNSVGSNFDFGDGSGTMKFSSDGEKVAVTFKEGGSNKLEIFDFDQETGEMTPYALLDLGTEGDIYGLEFSDDSNRVFVSYTNGGPGIEEYYIQGFEETDNSDPENPVTTVCPDCFEGAKFQTEIESCILSSKAVISGTESLPLGALQIGPDGQIYSAVVGSNQIGQVQVGGACNPSTFTQQGVAPMPGTTNLGLPSFVQNSGSSIPDPSLDGPDRLCLGNDIGARGVFEGGGEPDIDIYNWTIFDAEGEVVDEFLNGGEDFQELEYFFQETGIYTVQLQVDRCGAPWEEVFTHEVEVVPSPVITLPSEISLCGEEITLVAVDPDDPRIGEYIFRWVNAAGIVVGNSNELTVTEESIYTVLVAYDIPEEYRDEDEEYQTCPVSQSVFVGPPFEFTIDQSAATVCFGDSVSFSPDTPVSGTWSIRLGTEAEYSVIGETQELSLNTGDLEGPGTYELLFQTADPLNSNCTVERTATLEVTGLPEFSVVDVDPSQSCTVTNGSIVVEAVSQLDSLVLVGANDVFRDIQPNTQLSFDNLAPGNYIFTGYIGSCEMTHSAVVENSTPPDDLVYTVSTLPESCSDSGPQNGAVVIVFDGDPVSGDYTITDLATGEKFNATFSDRTSINVVLPAGTYSVEVANELGCTVPDPGTYEIVSGEEEVVLTSPGFCGGVVITEIVAEADLSFVDKIEWYNVVGASKNLIVGEEQLTLMVSSPGTYEIRLINAVGCLLGTGQITINQSDSTPPSLLPNYDICKSSNDLVTLEVGSWDSYEWSKNGTVVSLDPSFTPIEEGNYELMVIDSEGCDYTINFTITEVCEVNVVYPNAIRPGDPDRGFLIYTTGQLDTLTVLIYNRWGELIYFCEQENIAESLSVCAWDGLVNGRKVPSGTYPIVVKFTNEKQNINKIKRDAIVVIE